MPNAPGVLSATAMISASCAGVNQSKLAPMFCIKGTVAIPPPTENNPVLKNSQYKRRYIISHHPTNSHFFFFTAQILPSQAIPIYTKKCPASTDSISSTDDDFAPCITSCEDGYDPIRRQVALIAQIQTDVTIYLLSLPRRHISLAICLKISMLQKLS